jgi:selenide, water dikinase
VLGKLARQHDPNLLIGFDTADDAGVYQIAPDRALVQTVDFFTPIVDDPFTFGQIAATNALSDVYAMGGSPLTALTMVCFPEMGDLEVLQQILAGGLSKMMEANCTVAGGHSIRDPEIKFGYAVTGMVDPRRVLANATARAGDALIFTKAIGTGVISTAIKRGEAAPAWIDAAVKSMTMLNRLAAEVITRAEFDVHACTDVTGFGMIGHAREMAKGSGSRITINASRVPLLAGATECVARGFVPGGLKANREFAESCVVFDDGIDEVRKTLLFDPQTAGGLLVSVAERDAERLVTALHDAGVEHATIIGTVAERGAEEHGLIQVS